MLYTTYNQDGEIIGQMFTRATPPKNSIPGNYNNEYRVVDGKAVKKLDEEILSQKEADTISRYRSLRDKLLRASDWTQIPDNQLNEEQRQAWIDYRQALRDLPANTTDPFNVTWPTPPDRF